MGGALVCFCCDLRLRGRLFCFNSVAPNIEDWKLEEVQGRSYIEAFIPDTVYNHIYPGLGTPLRRGHRLEEGLVRKTLWIFLLHHRTQDWRTTENTDIKSSQDLGRSTVPPCATYSPCSGQVLFTYLFLRNDNHDMESKRSFGKVSNLPPVHWHMPPIEKSMRSSYSGSLGFRYKRT